MCQRRGEPKCFSFGAQSRFYWNVTHCISCGILFMRLLILLSVFRWMVSPSLSLPLSRPLRLTCLLFSIALRETIQFDSRFSVHKRAASHFRFLCSPIYRNFCIYLRKWQFARAYRAPAMMAVVRCDSKIINVMVERAIFRRKRANVSIRWRTLAAR